MPLPVIDADGEIQGEISRSDLAEVLSEQSESDQKTPA